MFSPLPFPKMGKKQTQPKALRGFSYRMKRLVDRSCHTSLCGG